MPLSCTRSHLAAMTTLPRFLPSSGPPSSWHPVGYSPFCWEGIWEGTISRQFGAGVLSFKKMGRGEYEESISERNRIGVAP